MSRAFSSVLAISLLIALLAAGCASPAASTSASTQSAPSAATVQPPGTVSASVSVEPVHISNMAFLIAATIKEIDVKAGDQVKAGQTLVVLDTPELQYAVTGAQAELHSAQTNSMLESSTRQYRAWTGRKWIWINGLPEVRAKADARVQQAQAALELAQAQLAQATLVAPFDGTVVSVNGTVGEMAVPNKTILVIGDLTHLRLETTDLSEREIASVHIGQTATARLKAFAQDLAGKVVAIAPLSTISNGDTVFKVTIEMDQPPAELLWGMSGDVNINVK